MSDDQSISRNRPLEAILSQLIEIGNRLGRVEAHQERGKEDRDKIADELGRFRDDIRDMRGDIQDLMQSAVITKDIMTRLEKVESGKASHAEMSSIRNLMVSNEGKIQSLHDWQQRFIGAKGMLLLIVGFISSLIGVAADAAFHYIVLGAKR